MDDTTKPQAGSNTSDVTFWIDTEVLAYFQELDPETYKEHIAQVLREHVARERKLG